MSWRSNNHNLWGHKFREEILKGLVVNVILRNAGLGAVNIFLPVFLYRVGGIYLAVAYMVWGRILEVAFGDKICRVIGKIGFKKSVIISSAALVILLLLLQLCEVTGFWGWAILAETLAPIVALMYWVPHHLLFLETEDKNYGKNSGILGAVGTWSAVIGPLLGGAIIVGFGFGTLFGWGMLTVVISMIPIMLLPEEKVVWNFNWGNYWNKVENKWFRRDFWVYVGWGIEGIMIDWFWPIFLLTRLSGSDLHLGGFKTLVLLFTSVLLLLIGKRCDTQKYNLTWKVAMFVLALMWFARGWISNKFGLLGLDVMYGWTGLFWFFPLGVYGLWRARSGQKTLYMVERETALNIGRVLAALGVGFLAAAGMGWEWMAGIGVIGVLLTGFAPGLEKENFKNEK